MQRRFIFLFALGLGLSGCDDSFFVSPAAPTSGLALSYSASSDPASAFARANRLRVRVTGPSLALDTLFPFAPATDTRIKLELKAPASAATHQVELTVLQDTLQLFRGVSNATLAAGETVAAEVIVDPVIQSVLLPSVFISSLDNAIAVGDTGRLIPRFATGDTISGPELVFSSSNSSALAVDAPTGRLRGLAAGNAMASIRYGASSLTLPLNVCPTLATSSPLSSAPGVFRLRSAPGIYPPGSDFTAAVFNNAPVLFSGGPLFGADSVNFVVGMDLRGTLPKQVSELAPVCTSTVAGGTLTRATMRLQSFSAVRVRYETFSTGDAFVLVRYTFTNTTATPVSNFRFGLAFDWDLMFDVQAGNDFTRFNTALNASEVFDNTGQMVGIASVSTPIVSYRPSVNSATSPFADPRTVGAYFNAINAGIATNTTGPQDIRDIIGVAPVTIAPGPSTSITFAMVGGTTAAQYAANVGRARAAAALFPAGTP